MPRCALQTVARLDDHVAPLLDVVLRPDGAIDPRRRFRAVVVDEHAVRHQVVDQRHGESVPDSGGRSPPGLDWNSMQHEQQTQRAERNDDAERGSVRGFGVGSASASSIAPTRATQQPTSKRWRLLSVSHNRR